MRANTKTRIGRNIIRAGIERDDDHAASWHTESVQMMLDEGGLRDVIESGPMRVAGQEYQLRLVGLSETPNNAVLLAIAVGGIDERLYLQPSDDLRRDPIALRQRVVYFARRIVTRSCQLSAAALVNAGGIEQSTQSLSWRFEQVGPVVDQEA